MTASDGWREVHEVWFPPSPAGADYGMLVKMVGWWMGGGATPELPRFRPMVEAARAGGLRSWCAVPAGRLSLILLLDQFMRGLYADTPAAYSSDQDALLTAEEGFRTGDFDALTGPAIDPRRACLSRRS